MYHNGIDDLSFMHIIMKYKESNKRRNMIFIFYGKSKRSISTIFLSSNDFDLKLPVNFIKHTAELSYIGFTNWNVT